MRVLVLGASGIIGSEICAVALDEGHLVTAVSRRGLTPRNGPVNGRLSIIAGDARSEPLLRSLASERYDAVVDLVSFDANALRSSLEILGRRVDQFVFVSSATIYGPAGIGQRIDEGWTRTVGPWEYPKKKIQAEGLLRQFGETTGQRWTIVRPYITYSEKRLSFGPWETWAILGRLRAGAPIAIGERLARSATSVIHARDVGRGIVALLGNPRAMNQDFHLASEETVTWRSVFDAAIDALGSGSIVKEVPDAQVEQSFPELAGKLHDRLSGRSFDSAKLRAAAPHLPPPLSMRAGYELAIASAGPVPHPATEATTHGRLDKILVREGLSSKVRRQQLEFARTVRRASINAEIRYSTERYAPLATAKALVKSSLRRNGSSYT